MNENAKRCAQLSWSCLQRFYPESSYGFPAKRSTLLGLIAMSNSAINSVSLAEASPQWPQALASVKPPFWEPLSSWSSFFFLFRAKQRHLSLHSYITSIIQFGIRCQRALYIPLAFNEGCRLCFELFNGWFKGNNFFNNLTYNWLWAETAFRMSYPRSLRWNKGTFDLSSFGTAKGYALVHEKRAGHGYSKGG